ncbi:MAG: AAA family ATPase [Patescibacteria group bacterium]
METKKFPFIVIEGIDGVGKTTCAKLLAEKLGGIYYPTPPKSLNQIRIEIEAKNDPILRFAFYFFALFLASREIKDLTRKKIVVCDRYLFSTIVYHQALGLNLSFIDFDQLPILSPDVCFYLFTDDQILKQRMAKRGIQSACDAALENDTILQNKIHELFLRQATVQIDTSKLTPDEVCCQIIKHLP